MNMSSAFYVVLEQPELGFDASIDGKALARSARRLSRIAQQLGVNELEHFISSEPAELENMLDDMDVQVDIPIPTVNWFDPQDGLHWATTIKAYLQINPEALRHQDAVLVDINQLEAILSQARDAKIRWHLAVDF